MLNPKEVSVVIPARNEAGAVKGLVAALQQHYPGWHQMLVVDDGSTDATAEAARAAGASVVVHPAPRGYGASLKSGIAAATGRFVLTLDGDGQHAVSDVRLLLEQAEGADMVSGHRKRLHHSRVWRLPGKWLLTVFCRYLVRRPIADLNCGLRIYRRSSIGRYARLCADGYSFTATSLVLFMVWGLRVVFVPADVRPASSQGRVTVRTGFDTLLLLLRLATLVDPLRVFLPISAVTAVAGIAWGIPYASAGRGVSVGALLLLLTALLLFAVGLLSDQIAQMRREQLER